MGDLPDLRAPYSGSECGIVPNLSFLVGFGMVGMHSDGHDGSILLCLE
jgi:hypothetical protein